MLRASVLELFQLASFEMLPATNCETILPVETLAESLSEKPFSEDELEPSVTPSEPKLNAGMLNPNPKNESVVSYTITDGIVEATSNIINPMVLVLNALIYYP